MVCLGNILGDTNYATSPFWNFVYQALPGHSYQLARLEVILCLALMVVILAPLYAWTRLPRLDPQQQRWLIGAGVTVTALIALALRLGPERP